MRVTGGRAPLLTCLGEAYLAAGRVADGLGSAAGALALAREHKERGHEAWALRLEGEIALDSGTRASDVAHDRLAEALELATLLEMRPLAGRCHAALGRLHARAGDRDEARAQLGAAAALFRDLGMTHWLEEAEAALARLR